MDLGDKLCAPARNVIAGGFNDSNEWTCIGPQLYDGDGTSADEMPHKIIVAVLTSLLAFVILIGNGLIIVSVTLVRKLRQPANYLIVSLALSDFLVALVVLPLTIVYDILGEWVFGSTVCNIHVSFDVICCTTSIMNLCMISIDRYLMITRPMTYPKRRTAKLMAFLITIAWVVSCLIVLPALFGFTENVTDDPDWIHLDPASGFLENVSSISLSNSWPQRNIPPNRSPCYNGSLSARQVAVDLQKDYYISKLRFENGGCTQCRFKIQLISPSEGNSSMVTEYVFNATSLTTVELPNVRTRFLRIFFSSEVEQNCTAMSFDVFGEITHGKTCLISQEGWFTIYSTVGAFYIPLAVMLCMYWKIYVEASRFKARHRARSKSISDQSTYKTKNRAGTSRKKETVVSNLNNYYSKSHARGVAILRNDQNKNKQEMTLMESPRIYACNEEGLSSVIDSNSVSVSCDDVFETLDPHRDNSSESTVSGFTKVHESDEEQCDVALCNKTSRRQEGGRGIMTYEVNCNTATNCGKHCTLGSTANWFNVLQYSSASLKKGYAPFSANLPDIASTVDHLQLNGHGEKGNRTHPDDIRLRIPRSPKSFNARRSILSSSLNSSGRKSLRTLGTRSRRGSTFFNPLRRVSFSSTRERLRNAKAIRTLGIIVIVFTFCWLPFFILTFIRPFVCEYPESQDCFPLWLVRLVLWLGYLNSALNPIIYIGFSPDLRETFRFLICCKCTNVDRHLAQMELRQAIESERKTTEQNIPPIMYEARSI